MTNGNGGNVRPASDRPDLAAKSLMSISSLLLIVGAAMLSLSLIKLAIPGLFESTALISYGRLRPAAFSVLVLGFGATITQAIAYYLTPRLVGASLRNERIATLNGYAYAGLVTVGTVVVVLRGADGGSFGEFPVWIDIPLAVSMVIAAVIVTNTVRDRTEAGSFPSLLFVLGGVWWYPALYIVANVDATGGVGNLLQAGVVTSGFLTLALPAAPLGAALYVTVRESDQPLFSGALARASFWTLAGTALVASPSRYMSGPAPAWLETIAGVMSLGLAVAGLTILANIALSISGSWGELSAKPALAATLSGAAAFAVLMSLTATQGFRSVAAVVGLTTWGDGLSLGIMLVAVPLLSMGFVFHAFPRAAGRSIFEPSTAMRGLRLTLWAGGATSALFIVAGIISGLSWNAGVASGAFANTGAGFTATLGSVRVLYTVASITSVVTVIGLGLLAWTFVRTFTSGAVQAAEVLMVEDTEDE